MSNYIAADTDLAAIADAIRTKGGTSAPLTFPGGFEDAIAGIQSGGQSVVLLASGSYTKTDAPSGSGSVNIPVSYTGTPTQVFVYAPDPVADTAQTYKWAWQVKQESEMETNLNGKLAIHKIKYANGNDNTYIGNISFSADGTTLNCGQQTSAYKVYSNTFLWYIWGYAT